MDEAGIILIVDDAPESRQLLAGLLAHHGFRTRAADSGRLALAFAAATPPDLILLDVRMPGMDGFEVCRRLKADPATAQVPVLFLSGATESEERARGFGLGAVDFVTKPFQADELLARVRTHLELGRLRHHLERRIAGKTRDLEVANGQLRAEILEREKAVEQQRQLQARVEQLQRLESIGQLAGGVAHEMNNALGAIMATASLLQAKGSASAPQAALILEACCHGRDTVKALLAFSGQGVLPVAAVDLNAVAGREAERVRAIAGPRVLVQAELQPGLPWILVEEAALAAALQDLSANALDAMPEGGTLTLRTGTAPSGRVRLGVEDTGQGMAEAVRVRAEEPFFTTKPFGKGRGLGLSTLSGLVRAHGGTLEILSAPGQGTQVLLDFPPAPEGAEGA